MPVNPVRFQQASSPPVTPQPASNSDSTSPTNARSNQERRYPSPLLRLKIEDLSAPAADPFIAALSPIHSTLNQAVDTVFSLLYSHSDAADPSPWPGTRSVTLALVDQQGGVANTSGRAIDHDHKVIKVSQSYVSAIPRERRYAELKGVLVHEMVHCWQYSGYETAPGGLIEGVADWVRLKAGMAPPHWKRDGGGDWDRGYQHTAYFLEWVEEKFGRGSVSRVNAALRSERYDEEMFWRGLFDAPVKDLWKQYLDEFKRSQEAEHSRIDDERDQAEEKRVITE